MQCHRVELQYTALWLVLSCTAHSRDTASFLILTDIEGQVMLLLQHAKESSSGTVRRELLLKASAAMNSLLTSDGGDFQLSSFDDGKRFCYSSTLTGMWYCSLYK